MPPACRIRAWIILRNRVAIFEGLTGTDNEIDALFEIEAQVLDDEINEQNHHLGITGSPNHAAKRLPSIHSLSSGSGDNNISSLPQPQLLSPPMMPSVASGTPPRASVQFPQDVQPMHSNDSNASSAVFMSDEDASSTGGGGGGEMQQQQRPRAQQLQYFRPPPVPLPLRHVRTRRDSVVGPQLKQLRGAGATTPQNGALMNPSISAVLEMTGMGSNTPTMVSPLGQLFGTVVIDDDDGQHDDPVGPALMRRRRTMSAAATDIGLGHPHGISSQHRRRASNLSSHGMRSEMFPSLSMTSASASGPGIGSGDSPQPETVQELEDEEEEEGVEQLREKRKRKEQEHEVKGDGDVMRLLGELGERQAKIEGQLEALLMALRRKDS